jgi:hypothetical protein
LFTTADKISKKRNTSNSLKAGVEPPLTNYSISKIRRGFKDPPSISLALNPDLRKRIHKAEAQLDKANKGFMADEPQSSDKPVIMAVRRGMILPGTRDAPKFSSKRPQELRRFLRQMEDLWQQAGVEDDQEKKEGVGKYADQESEEEWKSLETFEPGNTWEEYKDELIENYPEAAAAERGTPARIRQICRDAGGIALGDLTPLYAYRRAFTAEANKLTKPPAVMSNRELVELFMSGLSQNLAQAVLQYLGTQPKTESPIKIQGKGKEKEKKNPDTERRPEDRYDFNDICKAVVQVSENAQGMFRMSDKTDTDKPRSMALIQTTTAGNASLIEKIDSLEETQAREKDRITAANKQLDSKLESIESSLSSLKALLAQAPAKGITSSSQNFNGNSAGGNPEVQQRWVKNSQGMECFGCGGDDHFQDKCEKIKHHIKLGNLKLNQDGRVRLANGARVPNYPTGASLIERMERYYASKPPVQAYLGSYEEVEERSVNSYSKYGEPLDNSLDLKEQRLARMEKELQLKERESLLLARQLKLEDKSDEKQNRGAKASYILGLLEQLTDEELASVKDSKSGFL